MPYPIRTGTLFLLSALLLGGCDLIGSDEDVLFGTRIEFVAAGGLGGGVLQKLTVSEEGLVISEIVRPPLQHQLSQREHQELLTVFNGFFDLKATYDDHVCDDDITYTITLRSGERSKTVSAAGCSLSDLGGGRRAPARLGRMVGTLSELGREVYEDEAPWLGLDVDFSIDSDTYGLGEPILLTYRITNPTDRERTLYFFDEVRTGFSVSKQGVPAFYYTYPPTPDYHSEEQDLTPLVLGPGQEETLTYVWDQTVVDNEGNRIELGLGRYYLSMHLLNTSFFRTDEGIVFDVIDRSVPLAGHVNAYGPGEGSGSPDYTVELLVRNWTDAPVTLDFPHRERLYVKLYDLDGPVSETPPLVYEGPVETEDEATSLLLQPGETRTFSHTISKTALNPSATWYRADVELLTSNMAFASSGQVRITPYYPD